MREVKSLNALKLAHRGMGIALSELLGRVELEYRPKRRKSAQRRILYRLRWELLAGWAT